MEKKQLKILYTGNFELPDRNAAAHRVLSVSMALREIGYDVTLMGYGQEEFLHKWYNFKGFNCNNVFSYSSGQRFSWMTNIAHVNSFIEDNPETFAIIAYNYPSPALWRMKKLAKQKNIKIVSDCTEWYDGKSNRLIDGFVRKADSLFRMEYLQKHLDGIIAISSYLENYYMDYLPTVVIPPMVDINSDQYKGVFSKNHEGIQLIFVGNPSTSKERLDIIVNAMDKLLDLPVKLDVIGISSDAYTRMYSCSEIPRNVSFLGKLQHDEALMHLKESDYSLIIRDNTRLTNAGFPTKFVEALSCGTAVIATDTSDLKNYLYDGKNGHIVEAEDLPNALRNIITQKVPEVNTNTFDYHNYIEQLKAFMERI